MDIKEAINRIEDHMIVHSLQENRAIKITEAFIMAINVMEKQVPKKPIIQKHAKHENLGLALCPNCNTRIIGGYIYKPGDPEWNAAQKSYKHCIDCGQALDWSK